MVVQIIVKTLNDSTEQRLSQIVAQVKVKHLLQNLIQSQKFLINIQLLQKGIVLLPEITGDQMMLHASQTLQITPARQLYFLMLTH